MVYAREKSVKKSWMVDAAVADRIRGFEDAGCMQVRLIGIRHGDNLFHGC